MEATFLRSLGHIPACRCRSWRRSCRGAEQRSDNAQHEGRGAGLDGNGHHLLHGCCRRGTSKSCDHIGVCSPTEFSVESRAGYIIAQLLGGIAAAGFLWAMFGAVGLLGATTPGPGISDFKALIMEVLLTLGLVSTILGTASGARNIGTQRRSRGGRLYCPCGALGSTDQRGFYESRAVIRPRSGPRRNEHNLDLCRGPYNRRHDRRWV